MSEELDINAKNTNVSPVYRRMETAAKESSRRHVQTENLFTGMWTARGQHLPYMLPPGTKEKVLIMDECELYLTHSIIRDVKRYAQREQVQCSGFVLGEDGGFVDTGEPCPLCVAFGNPSMVAAIKVGSFAPYTRKKDNIMYPTQGRILLATQPSTVNALMDLAYSDLSGGRLKHLILAISRGPEQNSCKVGETFIIDKVVRGRVKDIPGIRQVVTDMKLIDMSGLFGPLSHDVMLSALRAHKRLCDENPGVINNGYKENNMRRALSDGTDDEDLDSITDSDGSVDPFESLDDIEDSAVAPTTKEAAPAADEDAPAKAADLEEGDDDEIDWDSI